MGFSENVKIYCVYDPEKITVTSTRAVIVMEGQVGMTESSLKKDLQSANRIEVLWGKVQKIFQFA